MAKGILLVGAHPSVGLTSTVMGIYHALDRKGISAACFKPILQFSGNTDSDNSFELMKSYSDDWDSDKHVSLDPNAVIDAMNNQHLDVLIEEIIQHYDMAKADADIVIIEGLLGTERVPYANEVNKQIAQALSADIIVVGDARVETPTRLLNQISVIADEFGGTDKQELLGAIINYVGGSGGLSEAQVEALDCFSEDFSLIGCIPTNKEIAVPRVKDLAAHLKATVLFEGDMLNRRVRDYVMFARTVPNATQFLAPGNCIFSSGDRDDVLMAVTIAATAGTQLACLVLTGPTEPSNSVFELCKPLLEQAQLPILHIDSSSWGVVELMKGFNNFIFADDEQRKVRTQEFFADHLEWHYFEAYLKDTSEMRLSTAAFRYSITKQAIAADKKIVLPEGEEPRTVAAAAQVAERKMARCVLLGRPEKVKQIAAQQGVKLGDGVTIIDPNGMRENYIERLVTLREHKGMNETLAREQLADNVMLGTMMLENNEVDGLVSGAIHTTANTMRPPLQIIKTAKDASIISSVFFMCLPDKVMVYADCAIVPRPNAHKLAQIAIQSNDTAAAFGINPKVAMISYSTGDSGKGEDVEKVKEATGMVKDLRPDIIVDGPLQYDAASVPAVAAQKAPNSPVAGQATIFIFPDLNTGNTTYKAVQRSANALSMGPILQGMRKPVNDLSRGALVEDIIYTIAITAVQAKQIEQAG